MKDQSRATKETLDELLSLSPEELRRRMDEHRSDPLALTLRDLFEFSASLMPPSGCQAWVKENQAGLVPYSLSVAACLILFFVEEAKGHISTIQLFNFLYLADLYSVKWQEKPLTDLRWVRYRHTPFEDRIYREIRQLEELGLVRQEESSLKPRSERRHDIGLPVATILMLENIYREWAGKEDEERLMDYVCNTAPMLEAVDADPNNMVPLDLRLEYEKLQRELNS